LFTAPAIAGGAATEPSFLFRIPADTHCLALLRDYCVQTIFPSPFFGRTDSKTAQSLLHLPYVLFFEWCYIEFLLYYITILS
jgi:hypothetical protein